MNSQDYDYLIVGAGLYGSVVAHELVSCGNRVLVIDRREHVGGNCYTRKECGITVHEYGPHIFNTDSKMAWDYVNKFAEFNNFVNSPVAMFNGKAYSLPFNMHTFSELFGATTPEEAMHAVKAERIKLDRAPANLEEQALSTVGRTVYDMLISGYTAKQWGRPCTELPASILKRVPMRFTYDNRYFDKRYHGVPVGGYTPMFDKILHGCTVKTGTDFSELRGTTRRIAKRVVFTGPIDAYFDFSLGRLEYRHVRFRHIKYRGCENKQGVAVMNHTGLDVPYTRSIEHKHFEFGRQPDTIVSYEYPCAAIEDSVMAYPVNDDRNNRMYAEYAKLAATEADVYFGGRLGTYKYANMDEVVLDALKFSYEVTHGRIR